MVFSWYELRVAEQKVSMPCGQNGIKHAIGEFVAGDIDQYLIW